MNRIPNAGTASLPHDTQQRPYYSQPQQQHPTLSHSIYINSLSQYQQQQMQQQQYAQQQQRMRQPAASSRNETLLAMRKHRSLDGGQFLSQFDNSPSTSAAYGGGSAYRDPTSAAGYPPAPPYGGDYYGNAAMPNFSPYSGYCSGGDEPPLPEYGNVPPPGAALDCEMLRRECATLNQKLGYVMNSIRTFWSPELKKERQLRKEEALRIGSLQYKLSQQAAEIQRVRGELEKREKDISQLLAESDLGDMEAELRQLRAHFRAAAAGDGISDGMLPPRDFTDKTPTIHELQTARAKMERSELTLAERSRELAACEVRLKCAEEQNAELEKRVEILSRGSAASDAQVRLLHDDLDVLRRKLESKNQQIESRDRQLKVGEKELEAARAAAVQNAVTSQEQERQIVTLTNRIDQLETLLRDRDAMADRLKQRLATSADAKAEAELTQRAENAERDRAALQAALDELRRAADAEKSDQLQVFQEETRQLRATIANLQKELADRHVLIVSQNEKISQLDAELRGAGRPPQTQPQLTQLPEAFEKAQNEIGRLLSIVRKLESEKSALTARLNGRADGVVSPPAVVAANAPYGATVTAASDASNQYVGGRDTVSDSTAAGGGGEAKKSNNQALRLRIEALEEALRESVGITSERDRLIAEQKRIIQQLSNQVAELFKSCGGKDLQKLLQEMLRRADTSERALRDERALAQRQIAGLRKEVILAVIREKDACIQLLGGSPEAIRDKIDVLTGQREQLKHRLLAVDGQPTAGAATNAPTAWDAPPPAVGDVYGGQPQAKAASALDLSALSSTVPPTRAFAGYSVHRPTPSVALSTFQPDGGAAAGRGPFGVLPPINIAVPAYGANYGVSAPASLSYGGVETLSDTKISNRRKTNTGINELL